MIMLTTLLPSTFMPATTVWDLFSFDSFAHIFLFSVLVFLMIVGLKKQFSFPQFRHYAIRYAFLISLIYGAIIELLQHYFIYGRDGNMVDFVSNSIGCLLGIIFFKWVYVW